MLRNLSQGFGSNSVEQGVYQIEKQYGKNNAVRIGPDVSNEDHKYPGARAVYQHGDKINRRRRIFRGQEKRPDQGVSRQKMKKGSGIRLGVRQIENKRGDKQTPQKRDGYLPAYESPINQVRSPENKPQPKGGADAAKLFAH